MEKTLTTRPLYHYLSLSELIGFFILNTIFIYVSNLISNFSVRFITYTEESKKNTLNKVRQDEDISSEDVEMVMQKIGMKLDECVGFDGFVSMFEEKEPSSKEVEEAFRVFDENCDGFIDAVELQRVLCKLGFREGEDLDACKMMIQRYDENRDGKINLEEFVKFLESSFC